MLKSPKFIFVVGGVISGVGKGTAVASISFLLQQFGYKVSAVKIDPYLNIDAGTMNPVEHGEVFVTKDGLECDQDIGNYERFLDTEITSTNYMTTGQVYLSVIQRERNLGYGGKCVETIPHVTQEVIARLHRAAQQTKSDILIVEVGGTVGEYQNLIFLEAGRILHLKNPNDVLWVLVSYLPIPGKIGEMKSKPTQHAVRMLNSSGIQPNFIICRSERPIDAVRKEKISVFCNLHPEDLISAPDVESIYDIPINFHKDRFGEKILKKLNLKIKKPDLRSWKKFVRLTKNGNKNVKIAIIGKYFGTGNFTLSDSYISVIEAVKHAAYSQKVKPLIAWLNADRYERGKNAVKELKKYDAIIVPGGFGARAVDGKMAAITFARENKIPFLGLCYGMQLAVIEFARNVCGLKGAHTTECDSKTEYPVIDIMADQKEKLAGNNYGGSMRLGHYRCQLARETIAARAYQFAKDWRFLNRSKTLIEERHRHRYEVNNKLLGTLTAKGLKVAGINPERNLAEIVELADHPYFVATQFHPEFKSRPLRPHPLFVGLIKAALRKG